MLNKFIPKTLYYIILISCLLISNDLFSKLSTGRFVLNSPKANSYVKKGELFIACELKGDKYLKKQSVRIFLDDYIINYQAKLTDKRVSLLYTDNLKDGKHSLKIIGKSKSGTLQPIEINFFIGDSTWLSLQNASFSSKDTIKKEKTKVGITGFINFYNRIENISGKGSALRQEPPFTRELNVNIEPSIGKVSFPIQAYLTTNEISTIQPRNRFRVGFKSTYFEAHYGTDFPFYDPLVIAGARVDGGEVVFKFRKIQLRGFYGSLNKSIEGQKFRYKEGSTSIPSSLDKDSNYIESGTYKRMIMGARIQVGRPEEGSLFGITMMKATDDTSSIKYGLYPKQNIAGSIDQDLVSPNKVFHLVSGIGISMLTNDISKGVTTQAEIDSLYRKTLPLDPVSFKDIIILNSSTSPLLIQNKTSAAWYVRPSLNFRNNSLNVAYTRTGPEFYSFANPFMRQDLQEISIGDNINLLKRRLIFQIKVLNNENNLYGKALSTVKNNIYSGTVIVSPGKNIPQLSINYRLNNRFSENEQINSSKVNDKIVMINANINWRVSYYKNSSFISFNYNTSERNSLLKVSNSKNNVISFVFQHDFKFPLSIGWQFSHFDITSGLGKLQDVSNNSFFMGYRLDKIKANIGFNASFNKNSKTEFSNLSNRNTYNLNYRQSIWKGLAINIDGGISEYADASEYNSYIEQYFNGGLTYTF